MLQDHAGDLAGVEGELGELQENLVPGKETAVAAPDFPHHGAARLPLCPAIRVNPGLERARLRSGSLEVFPFQTVTLWGACGRCICDL